MSSTFGGGRFTYKPSWKRNPRSCPTTALNIRSGTWEMLMTLENTLLEKLSEWQPQPGRHELHVADGGWRATVTADRSDALGCLLWELRLQREGTAEIDVQKWAVAAAERVNGLMQPLKVVEVDTLRNEAQLRSDSPSERGGKRLYHELLL